MWLLGFSSPYSRCLLLLVPANLRPQASIISHTRGWRHYLLPLAPQSVPHLVRKHLRRTTHLYRQPARKHRGREGGLRQGSTPAPLRESCHILPCTDSTTSPSVRHSMSMATHLPRADLGHPGARLPGQPHGLVPRLLRHVLVEQTPVARHPLEARVPRRHRHPLLEVRIALLYMRGSTAAVSQSVSQQSVSQSVADPVESSSSGWPGRLLPDPAAQSSTPPPHLVAHEGGDSPDVRGEVLLEVLEEHHQHVRVVEVPHPAHQVHPVARVLHLARWHAAAEEKLPVGPTHAA